MSSWFSKYFAPCDALKRLRGELNFVRVSASPRLLLAQILAASAALEGRY